MRTRLSAALVALIAIVAVGSAIGAAGATSPAKSTRAHALNRALHGLVHMRGGPPGALAIVQKGHHRRVFRAGVANVRSGRRFRVNDHMRLASTSKAFSGAVTLSLVDRGKLKLRNKARKLLPWLPGSWHKVTLRELLNHTSGLADFSADDDFRSQLGQNPHRRFTPRQLVGFVKHKHLVFTPGTDYEYSNTDNIVAALMARAATHRSYNHLLRKLVYSRLGLHETSLPRGYHMPHPFAHGYDVTPPNRPQDVSTLLGMSGAWSSGGMRSTPADLNRFIRGYAGGHLFAPSVRRKQLHLVKGGRSDPPGPGKNSAGLAIFRYRMPCGTVFGHTGNIPGYTQFAAAGRNGRRSVTVSVTKALSTTVGGNRVFKALHRTFRLAACAALAR